MTESEARRHMWRIEKELMYLANENNGNNKALDAILDAQLAIHNFTGKG